MAGIKRDGDSEGDSGFVTPDSTTKEKMSRFVIGEDVLSHGKDGLYYLGTIVMVDVERDRCFVQFEDRTAHWSLYKDLTKLRLPDSDELCVICKSSRSYDDNEIVLCSICDLGFHQNCLQPAIENYYCENGSQWECPHCVCDSAVSKEEKKKSKENSPRKQKTKNIVPEDETVKHILPYDLHHLSWDEGHKSNKEQSYCYCGGPGEWYNRMVQCQRCRQWFHEACIDCLHFNLLYGDRFYVFVCSLCNGGGSEFLHRLDIKWIDVVHLAIFNLALHESKMYFELSHCIVGWINENWESLQCPLPLQSVSVAERSRVVLKVLENNRQRFKCGKEVRKRASLWGLRAKVPPPVPTILLPQTHCVTEQVMKNVILKEKKYGTSPPMKKMCKIKEELENETQSDPSFYFSPAKKRPPSPSYNLSPEEIDHIDQLEHDVKGDEVLVRRKRKRELDILMDDKKAKKMIEEISMWKSSSPVPSGAELPGGLRGDRPQVGKKRRGRPRKGEESAKVKEKLSLKRKKSSEDMKADIKIGSFSPTGDTSCDDTSSHGTLESFIPPPSNFDGYNNPFLNMDSIGYGIPIARPLMRKLSEHDIKIGKNGEVKRRRYRRKLDKAKFLYLMQNTSIIINGANSIKLNGSIGAFTLSDLKSTVNTYFGAANRIANGEKFHILAKRNTCDDKLQYLIEWETAANS